MSTRLHIILPCVALPVVFFTILAYPVIDGEVERRLPLLSICYLSRHLAEDIAAAEAPPREFPPNYGSILAEYGDLARHEGVRALAGLSSTIRVYSPSESTVAAFILRRRSLPRDLLTTDPVKRIETDLAVAREKARVALIKQSEIVAREELECLKQAPPSAGREVPVRRGLPQALLEKGMVFCGETIPLERPDVHRRIAYQVEHLLGDMRDTTVMWLKRKARYAPVVESILNKEGVPSEFVLLPALESGYSGTVISPATARGWWQFLKTTATESMARDPALDWTLKVESWRDERSDLALSTRSAARYLTWMRTKLTDGSTPMGWLSVAAAYNAGLSEIAHRAGVYGTGSYWDMKLPIETEDYVPRWIALAIIDAHRDFYGMPASANAAATFDTLGGLELARDVPLSLLAALTTSSVRCIRELNPGLSKAELSFRAVIDNSTISHTIHVPARCGESVVRALKDRGYLKQVPAELEVDRGRRS